MVFSSRESVFMSSDNKILLLEKIDLVHEASLMKKVKFCKLHITKISVTSKKGGSVP